MELQRSELPAETLRLFDGYDPAELATPAARDFVIGRLLEEGDRTDLAWLASCVGRGALAEWVARRADRQLSRRSRLFWQRALPLAVDTAIDGADADAADAADGGAQIREALWPL